MHGTKTGLFTILHLGYFTNYIHVIINIIGICEIFLSNEKLALLKITITNLYSNNSII